LSLAGDDTTLFFCSVVDPASAVRDIPIKAPFSPAELHAAARAACEDGVREASRRCLMIQIVRPLRVRARENGQPNIGRLFFLALFCA
jgi:hypothetical protein